MLGFLRHSKIKCQVLPAVPPSQRKRGLSEQVGPEPLLPSALARAPLHAPTLGLGFLQPKEQFWNPVIKSTHSFISQMRKLAHWRFFFYLRSMWVSELMPEWELAHGSLNFCIPHLLCQAGILLEPITGLFFPLPGHCLVEKALSRGCRGTENIQENP